MSDRGTVTTIIILFAGVLALLVAIGWMIASSVRGQREQRAVYEAAKGAPSVGDIDIIDLPDGRRAYTMRSSHGVAIFVMEQPSAK